MIRKVFIPILLLAIAACNKKEEHSALRLVERIDSLHAAGCYAEVLDSVESLRLKYPKAVEARRHALKVWQEASLALSRQDVGRTDSALQAVKAQMKTAKSNLERNKLRVRCDSLQARYDILCTQVRYIVRKQTELDTHEEEKTPIGD